MNYRIEPLESGFCAAVSKAHGFSADAFMLADFAAAGSARTAADFCCGCGIIALLLVKSNPALRVTAADIDAEACALARLSALHSGCADRLRVIQADLREYEFEEKFDLITVNPPFFTTGRLPDDPARAAARHALSFGYEQAAKAAGRCLADGGRLVICGRPEDGRALETALASAALYPTRRRLCADRRGAAPFLLLVEAEREQKTVFDEPPLYVRDEEDRLTAEYKKLYGGFYL